MLIIGSLLALLCGLANSAAAALEKREVMRGGNSSGGFRRLAALARRGWWMVAMALSLLAWCAEAGALGLAPVPLVTTLRSAGRGGLVVAGHRWLGERFRRVELAAIALLAAGGILTASSVASTNAAAPPLSDITELLVALAATLLVAVLGRSRRGLVLGAAVGVLFIATGVFTKEIGDRIVRDGAAGVLPLLLTPGPWLSVAFSVWAFSLLATAFERANTATVSATTTTVSANGLIAAGVLLYHQPLAASSMTVPLVAGLVLSAVGAVALIVAMQGRPSRPGRRSARAGRRAPYLDAVPDAQPEPVAGR